MSLVYRRVDHADPKMWNWKERERCKRVEFWQPNFSGREGQRPPMPPFPWLCSWDFDTGTSVKVITWLLLIYCNCFEPLDLFLKQVNYLVTAVSMGAIGTNDSRFKWWCQLACLGEDTKSDFPRAAQGRSGTDAGFSDVSGVRCVATSAGDVLGRVLSWRHGRVSPPVPGRDWCWVCCSGCRRVTSSKLGNITTLCSCFDCRDTPRFVFQLNNDLCFIG